mmetsp:Transcript_13648/g.32284  ORF Transcript_13648/g.32284 Transcript_13648/m.32284 type:complete len:128 (+) Transcript_13648:851-1234(+)
MDQFNLADRVARSGAGVWLDTETFSALDVMNTVSLLTSDPTYAEAAARLHHLAQDDTVGGGAEVGVRFVEHLIQYGSDHLRCENDFGPFYSLRLLLVTEVLLLPVALLVLACRCCCRPRRKNKEKTK